MSELEDLKRRLELLEARLNESQDKPMNIQEAAQYLGLSVSYLYRLTYQKKIPFTKPTGKVIYFMKSNIDEWVRKGRGRRDRNKIPNNKSQITNNNQYQNSNKT